jgi:hypothetical protein
LNSKALSRLVAEIVEELRRRTNARDQKVVVGAGARDVEQVAFGCAVQNPV